MKQATDQEWQQQMTCHAATFWSMAQHVNILDDRSW